MKEGTGQVTKKLLPKKKTVLKIRVNKLCWKNEVINQQQEVKKWMSETFTNKQENSQTDVKKKKKPGSNEGYFS